MLLAIWQLDRYLVKENTKSTITNPNYISELPLKTAEKDALNSLNQFNMYNLDPILRRSKPLQSTKESLGDS